MIGLNKEGFNQWWDSDGLSKDNSYEEDTPAFWSWEGWQAGVAAEREKLKHELLTLEKWKGMALAKDGDGRTVQEVEREAREAEREECAKVCDKEMEYAETWGTWGQVMTADKLAVAIRARGQ